MTQARHTPGPWFVQTDEYNGVPHPSAYVKAMKSGTPTIAFVYGEARSSTYEARNANARLIVAAPELLAALELALFSGEHDGPAAAMATLNVQGRAAIAKARGE